MLNKKAGNLPAFLYRVALRELAQIRTARAVNVLIQEAHSLVVRHATILDPGIEFLDERMKLLRAVPMTTETTPAKSAQSAVDRAEQTGDDKEQGGTIGHHQPLLFGQHIHVRQQRSRNVVN